MKTTSYAFKLQDTKVLDFAAEYSYPQWNLVRLIDRAVSFCEPKLGGIWTIPVKWNTSLRSSGGHAYLDPKHYHIALHPLLRSEKVGAVESVFLHEVAHILAHMRHGASGHGWQWAEAMFQLGQVPKRTHSFNLRREKETLSLEDLI